MDRELGIGFIYTFIGKYSNVLLMIGLNIVLSRILTPDDFGVVSILSIFITFFQLLIDAGVGPAIVQNRELTNKELAAIFNYVTATAFVFSILFGFFGMVIAKFYDNSIFVKLTWIQAPMLLFIGMSIVPNSLMLINLEFKKINFFLIISNFVSAIFSLSLALLGFGVYALAALTVTSAFINVLFLLNQRKFSINIREWSFHAVGKIGFFAKNQFLFNFVNYFARNSDNFLIGKYMGLSTLGYYSKAYQLIMYPNSLLLGVISPVLQPVFSKHQDKPELIWEYYRKILRILGDIGIPITIYFVLNGQNIILALFGSQWMASVVPFKILSLTIWIQLLLSSTGAIFQAMNKPTVLLLNGIVGAIIIVGSIILGILSGNIIKLSWILTIGFYLNFLVGFYLVMKNLFDMSIFEVFKQLKVALFVTIITAIPLYCFIQFIDFQNEIAMLILSLIVFMGTWLISMSIFGEIKYFLQILKK